MPRRIGRALLWPAWRPFRISAFLLHRRNRVLRQLPGPVIRHRPLVRLRHPSHLLVSSAQQCRGEGMEQEHFNADLERAAELALEGRAEEARQLYERLSRKGSWYAKVQLGYLFLKGKEVAKDVARAEELFQQAAELGSYLGKYYLGLLYQETGREDDAYREIRELTELGYLPAVNRLGWFLEDGIGCEKDLLAAVHYRTYAAQNGHLQAQKWVAMRKMMGRDGLISIPIGLAQFIKATAGLFWMMLKAPTDPRVQG